MAFKYIRVGLLCRVSIMPTKRDLTISCRTLGLRKAESVKQKKKEKHFYETALSPWKNRNEFIDDIFSSILYQDEHIVAFNKPNGVPMHALKYTEDVPPHVEAPVGEDYSLSGIVPDLKVKLGSEELIPVLCQNRLYSGVVVYGKSKEAEKRFERYFRYVRSGKVFTQVYQALTIRTPTDLQTEEKITLQQQKIGDWLLSTKTPSVSKKKRERRMAICPVIQLKILNTFTLRPSSAKGSTSLNGLQMALVELIPTTPKWDALEVFLLHHLSPVLGDHRYSSRLKTVLDQPILLDPASCFPAPQELPKDFLHRVGLTESQTGHVLLHVHCSSVTVPLVGQSKGTTVEIKAPLPDFFNRTLQCLRETGQE